MKVQSIFYLLIIFCLLFSCKNNKQITSGSNKKVSKNYSLIIKNAKKIGYNKFMLNIEITNNTSKKIWFPTIDNEIIFFGGHSPNSYGYNSYYIKLYDKRNERIYPDNIINCDYCDSINNKRRNLADSLEKLNDNLSTKINKDELIEKDYLWFLKNKSLKNNFIIIKPNSVYKTNVLLDFNYSIRKNLVTHGSTYYNFYDSQEVETELILYTSKNAHHYLTKSQKDSLNKVLGFKNIVYDTLYSNKVKLFVEKYKE